MRTMQWFLSMLTKKLSPKLVPKLDFAVPKFDCGGGHGSKQAIRTTVLGTRTMLIRAMPKIFRSVNDFSRYAGI